MVSKVLKKLITALLTIIPISSFAELVIIANKDLAVTSLTREQIYRIYLGKTKFLPNGVKVIPVDQKAGTYSHDKFYAEIIQKSETDIKSYWSRVIFTGQGYPPIQESDDQSVKDLVAKNPNCMGYIDKSNLDDSVKVLYSIP